MEVVFIDSEPPGAAGGGIRTYVRLALDLCRGSGVPARVYTHTPAAYPGAAALPIGRKAWLRAPFRGLAYRLLHAENALWEHAYWLERELAATDAPGRVYEFCDYLGYGFFALRNPTLRPRCQVRVHTPAFLIPGPPVRGWARVAAGLTAWRERECLRRAPFLAAPSAEFVRERLPALRGWRHVPNPLPPPSTHPSPDPLRPARLERSRSAAVTPDPGPVPPSGDPAWSAAPRDAAEAAEAARASDPPRRILPARFLYLGRVERRKGVLVLLRAFLRLAAERPFASLSLVGSEGEPGYAREVRALLDALPPELRGRLAWEPPCPPEARPDLLDRFTALAVPSLWENSPYVYFEGMAAGLSCIGSATGEMKAVARETGALSPPAGDEEAWLEALRAHCDGKDAGVPAAQEAWLAAHREDYGRRLLEAWRAAATAGGSRA
jgi:glycosyltransferase involved in cell wall biosynthesis